jgi:hypothetical protein
MTMDLRRQVPLLVLLMLLVSACASSPAAVRCQAGERPALVESLYFGAAKPNGVVTDNEWDSFVAKEIAPRFPDGFTIWPAEGEWRSADGGVVRERSHVLQVITFDDPSATAKLKSIIEAYELTFQQEAVMRIRSESCVSFNARPRR